MMASFQVFRKFGPFLQYANQMLNHAKNYVRSTENNLEISAVNNGSFSKKLLLLAHNRLQFWYNTPTKKAPESDKAMYRAKT